MEWWGLVAAVKQWGGTVQEYKDPEYDKSYMIHCRGKVFHLRGVTRGGLIMRHTQWEVGYNGNYQHMHMSDIRDFIVGILPPDKI